MPDLLNAGVLYAANVRNARNAMDYTDETNTVRN